MNLRNLYIVILVCICCTAQAQDSIRGIVYYEDNNAQTAVLPGAYIHWANEVAGAYSSSDGSFAIPRSTESKFLIASFTLYTSDTVYVSPETSEVEFTLRSSSIKKVTVFARLKTYGLSGVEPRTTINLSEREFQKAACCNLSESFQNAPAIDVSFGDAVTGTRQIKMLGLDGYYTLISREYMPTVRLLNSYYGMNYIPASWVKSIQITKGAGSIVNGYESIAGQINIEMKKPFDGNKFLLDQFISESGRAETDLMYQINVGQHVATAFFGKLALLTTIQDRNGDNFVDNPFGQQVALMNRWQFYTDRNVEGQFNIAYNKDSKRAGTTSFVSERDVNGYGILIDNEQYDAWSKVGIVFPDKPYQSIGTQFRFNHTKMTGKYGSAANDKIYTGRSNSYYANIMLETIIKNTFHKIKTGVSFLGDDMNEEFMDFKYARDEFVPGAFLEYTYQPKEQLSFVLGVRGDYNSIYGASVTPRFHSKWRFNGDNTSIRTSAGMGRRTSNILAQNQQIFPSNRTLNIIESNSSGAYGLDQEVAFNTGISLEHQFRLLYFPVVIYLDFFHTSFLNEVVFDREVDGKVYFYNMENGTRANSFQTQLDISPFRRTEVRLAYRMFVVSSLYQNPDLQGDEPIRLQKAFIAKNRAFVNITQGTRKGWQFSSTLTWYGPQRIPGITQNGSELTVETEYSPDFILWNFQIAKTFEFPFELYLGAENLLNYRQENPIQMANDTDNSMFDAGLVWGPVFGRMIYGGFRIRIDYKEHPKEEGHETAH